MRTVTERITSTNLLAIAHLPRGIAAIDSGMLGPSVQNCACQRSSRANSRAPPTGPTLAEAASMTLKTTDPCIVAKEMLADLYFLIEALDRRVPRLEQQGEAQIAHDAADLRERAVSLIRQIEGTTPKQ